MERASRSAAVLPRSSEPTRPALTAPGRVRRVPADEVFDSARRGGGGPLPHLDRMRRAFGGLVDRIEVHTGAAEARAALGARAATRGHVIAFAESSPDVATVAHELAHAAQAQRGGGTRAGFGADGGPAEREADAIAARIGAAAPGPVEVHEALDGAIHRKVEPGLAKGRRVRWNGNIVTIVSEDPGHNAYVVGSGATTELVEYDHLDPVCDEITAANFGEVVMAFRAADDLDGLIETIIERRVAGRCPADVVVGLEHRIKPRAVHRLCLSLAAIGQLRGGELKRALSRLVAAGAEIECVQLLGAHAARTPGERWIEILSLAGSEERCRRWLEIVHPAFRIALRDRAAMPTQLLGLHFLDKAKLGRDDAAAIDDSIRSYEAVFEMRLALGSLDVSALSPEGRRVIADLVKALELAERWAILTRAGRRDQTATSARPLLCNEIADQVGMLPADLPYVLLPTGFQEHCTQLVVRPRAQSQLDALMFNSGFGLTGWHRRREAYGEVRYQTFTEVCGVPLHHLADPEFWHRQLRAKYGNAIDPTYENVMRLPATAAADAHRDDPIYYERPQVRGSCTWQSLLAVIRYMFIEHASVREYKKAKALLSERLMTRIESRPNAAPEGLLRAARLVLTKRRRYLVEPVNAEASIQELANLAPRLFVVERDRPAFLERCATLRARRVDTMEALCEEIGGVLWRSRVDRGRAEAVLATIGDRIVAAAVARYVSRTH